MRKVNMIYWMKQNKNKCNIGLNIEEIEDASKQEKSRDVDNRKVKREGNEGCPYDILDETVILEGCIIKDIEEIKELSKVQKSRELNNKVLKRISHKESQYDILDDTEAHII